MKTFKVKISEDEEVSIDADSVEIKDEELFFYQDRSAPVGSGMVLRTPETCAHIRKYIHFYVEPPKVGFAANQAITGAR